MEEVHQTLTAEEAFNSGEPVLLYNPTYREYVFVSNDKKGNDNVALSHPYRDEPRNLFVLQRTSGLVGLLYNPTYQRWLFVTNDKSGTDHVVEAHQYKNEERNKFTFQSTGGDKYRIFNASYNEYVFVSNDKHGTDHMVLSHPYPNEDRNEFQLMMSENPKVKNIEFYMEQSRVVEKMAPMTVGQMSWPNKTSVVQSMAISISQTKTFESTMTYSGGFRIEGTVKYSAGIPAFLGSEVSVTVETSHNWSKSTTNTSSVQITGTVTVNVAPHALTEAKCQVKLQKVNVPYKMTLVSKNGNQFFSYGNYEGVSMMEMHCESEEKPLI